jgi:thiaminase/transcriptional activator TenA
MLSHNEHPSADGLSARLRASVLPLWERQLTHPFVVALGDGSLPRTCFEFYIRQDARFLDTLARCFAYAAAKAADHTEMEHFARLLLNTLLVEQDLHRRYAERFGISAAEMAATPLAPTCYAYTRHLLAVATTGTLAEILTAVLPCAWIYAEVGAHLTARRPPAADHPYADWLETYADPQFDAVGLWLRQSLDRHATQLTDPEIARLQEIFRISTAYEWLFWEMAWRQEAWPA